MSNPTPPRKSLFARFRLPTSLAALALVSAMATSAGQEQQPLQLAQVSDGFDVEATYMTTCFACHSTGLAGAPKVGPEAAADWNARLEAKGLDAVVQSVINGLNTMPPKGLCFACTDADLRAIVEYMIDSSIEKEEG